MAEERYKKAEYNGHTIEFWDKYTDIDGSVREHVYLVDGFELPSVTQVLQKQGIAPIYPDTDAVRKAQERGTFVHADCEKVFAGKPHLPLTTEGRWVKDNILPKFKDFNAEVLLCTDKYAGQNDLICKTLDDSANVIIDYKSGGYDDYVVSWQEKLYLEGQKYCKLIDDKLPTIYYVAELREKYEDCKLIQIDETSDKEYKKLYAVIGTEKQYQKPTSIIALENYYPDYTNADLERFCTELGQLPITIQYAFAKKIKNWVEAKDKEVKAKMLELGITRAKTYDGCTWEIGDRTQTRLDLDALKEEEPELYKKYLKTTTSKVLHWKGHPMYDARVTKPNEIIEEQAEVKEIAND